MVGLRFAGPTLHARPTPQLFPPATGNQTAQGVENRPASGQNKVLEALKFSSTLIYAAYGLPKSSRLRL